MDSRSGEFPRPRTRVDQLIEYCVDILSPLSNRRVRTTAILVVLVALTAVFSINMGLSMARETRGQITTPR